MVPHLWKPPEAVWDLLCFRISRNPATATGSEHPEDQTQGSSKRLYLVTAHHWHRPLRDGQEATLLMVLMDGSVFYGFTGRSGYWESVWVSGIRGQLPGGIPDPQHLQLTTHCTSSGDPMSLFKQETTVVSHSAKLWKSSLAAGL